MSYLLALLAGMLVAFSPCILPVLPLIVGSALQKDRLGPLFLSLGIVISFTTVGVFISAVGFSIGLSPDAVRSTAAVVMAIFGTVLVIPRLQSLLDKILAPISGSANKKMASGSFDGKTGQFFIGVLLGAVWSPCVGPILGAAFSMASQGENVVQAGTIMLVFSVGTTLPLLLIAYVSRGFFSSNQKKLIKLAEVSRRLLGVILLVIGLLVFSGLDKKIESVLVKTLPQEWIEFVTAY